MDLASSLDPTNNVMTNFLQSAQNAAPGQADEVNDSQKVTLLARCS